jgi:hypothetical protein
MKFYIYIFHFCIDKVFFVMYTSKREMQGAITRVPAAAKALRNTVLRALFK